MRPRIKRRVDIQEVVSQIEYRIGVYTQCIKHIMQERGLSYKQAKKSIDENRINRYKTLATRL